jgi:transglutaminase-like putative cysteine protease
MANMKTHLLYLLPRIARAMSLGIVLAHALPAHSADTPDYRYTRYERVITIDDSGRAVRRVTLSLVLSSDAALQRFSQYAVSYDADLQTLTIDNAQTVHANGEKLPANLKDAVFDRPAPTTAVAPMFSSEHLRFIAFPAVGRGDTVQLSYTLADRETMLPGKFNEIAYFPPTEAYDNVQETLDTPVGMPVRIDAKDMQSVSNTVQGTRHVQIYSYRTPASGPVHEQADPVSPLDTGPYFIATNFADYAQLGQAYGQRAQPQMRASEPIRKLADQLTQNVTDRRQQAMLIYDWVSRNIRYVAAWVGSGPVVPHSAAQVMSNGYGDCKDHDALFIALLRAKGISADTVLVNLGNSYRLPSAPALAVFNHAITWLPELGVFADTTSGFSPFGILTFSSSDKPALDTVTGQILHTPPQNGENSRSSSNFTIKVGDDGNAVIHGVFILNGQATFTPRLALSQYKADRIGYELLKRIGLTGSLRFAAPSIDEIDQPLNVDLIGTVNNMALMPGPAALAIPVMPGYSSIKAFADYVLAQASQPIDGPCAGTTVHEHYNVTLPASAQIIAIPPDVESRNGEIDYTASYRQNGQHVEIDRVLQRNFQTNVCSGAMLKQWFATALEISTDLKRQILYR